MNDKIIAHAKKMRVAADSTHAKCVDGGYRGEEAVGAIAMPGAHLGISMALLQLGFSPEEAFELVYKFVTKDGNPYCWHTDTHEGHHGTIVGCGHCNAAISKGEKYSVAGLDVQELLDLVRSAQNDRENMELVILDREHKEEAILVVTSTDYTVKPWDQENDVQFFIYDKVRHLDLLKRLVEYLNAQGKSVSYEALVEASDKQTTATLGLLGSSKGKPIYTVDVSTNEPVVEMVGNAPIFE
ncbi:MAG: hypothetical protein BroJett025_10340 [Patescibacteria group bacterium]|nr:MAG: hypothetical protein BroJett025_10340 [Patescibacteria group bacterium]